tara:strand:+ start:1047 stop:2099 length:1053 start_codon:yes stop_codon:yes gene_type:complete
MSDETINEVEATETTEAIEQVTEQVTEDMPLPEGLETAGAKGDDNVLNTLLGVMAEQEDAQPSEEPMETVVMDEAPTQAEESEPEPTADNRGSDYERALAALLRDGTPRHLLDEEYERNPDRFVDWGMKRAKVQADGDRFSQEHADLKSKLEATHQEGVQTEGEDQGGNTPQAEAQPTMQASMETQRSQIADIFGDEAANAVMQPIQSMAMGMQQIMQQQEMRLFQLSQMVEQKELSSVRSQLQERFPQLAEDKAYEQVQEKMRSLVQTGQYNTYSDVMLDAARITLADAVESGDKATKINQAKSAGQPKRRSTASTATRPRTVDDRDDQVLESLMSGMTQSEIAKQFKS